MQALAKSFLAQPNDLRLHDLLVEWKAKELSVMSQWKNFRAGGNYLPDSQEVEVSFTSFGL